MIAFITVVHLLGNSMICDRDKISGQDDQEGIENLQLAPELLLLPAV